MPAWLTLLHAFPQDLSPIEQSAGGDDEDNYGKGAERAKGTCGLKLVALSASNHTSMYSRYKSLIKTCCADAERQRREKTMIAVTTASSVFPVLCISLPLILG